MKISTLIKRLEKAKREHGDLEVTLYQWNDPLKPHRAQGTEVVQVKRNYKNETFVLVDRLENGGWAGGPMFIPKYQERIKKRPNLSVFHIYYNRVRR